MTNCCDYKNCSTMITHGKLVEELNEIVERLRKLVKCIEGFNCCKERIKIKYVQPVYTETVWH